MGQQTDYFTFSKAECLLINPHNSVNEYHYLFSLHDAVSLTDLSIDSRFTID